MTSPRIALRQRITALRRHLIAVLRGRPARPCDPRTTLAPRVVVRSDGFAYVTFCAAKPQKGTS